MEAGRGETGAWVGQRKWRMSKMTQTRDQEHSRDHEHRRVTESKINGKHLNRTSDKHLPLLQMAAGRFGFARSQEQNV